MKRFDFYVHVVQYIEQEILPKVKEGARYWLGGMLFALPNVLEALVQRYADFLRVIGVLDPNGNVDVVAVKSFLQGAFKSQPVYPVRLRDMIEKAFPGCAQIILDYFDVTVNFTVDDAGKFIEMLG